MLVDNMMVGRPDVDWLDCKHGRICRPPTEKILMGSGRQNIAESAVRPNGPACSNSAGGEDWVSQAESDAEAQCERRVRSHTLPAVKGLVAA